VVSIVGAGVRKSAQKQTTMSAVTAAFAESGHGILTGMSIRPRSQAGLPMTLGNMRANGVRSLDVSRAGSAITGRS
jgi:hypothetical protein